MPTIKWLRTLFTRDSRRSGIRQEKSKFSVQAAAESLESRQMLSNDGAFSLIGLDTLRNDPNFVNIDGENSAQRMSVAVLDTGLAGSHSLLSGNFVAYVDFVDDEFSGGNRVIHTEVDPNYWTTGERFLERVQTRFERLGR